MVSTGSARHDVRTEDGVETHRKPDDDDCQARPHLGDQELQRPAPLLPGIDRRLIRNSRHFTPPSDVALALLAVVTGSLTALSLLVGDIVLLWAQPNCVKSCAPAATLEPTDVAPPFGTVPTTVTVFVTVFVPPQPARGWQAGGRTRAAPSQALSAASTGGGNRRLASVVLRTSEDAPAAGSHRRPGQQSPQPPGLRGLQSGIGAVASYAIPFGYEMSSR